MVTNRYRINITLSQQEESALELMADRLGMTKTGLARSFVIGQLRTQLKTLGLQINNSPSEKVTPKTAPNLHRHKGNKKRR